MTTRRELLWWLVAGALAPRCVMAQAQKVWHIGVLSPESAPVGADRGVYRHLLDGLRDLGYVEGKNIAIEWRYADEKFERLPALAADLAQLKVDVIVTTQATSIRAAQSATRTIPIVFLSTGDPVANGFATSLAHPGGNITGMSNQSGDLDVKRLELLMSAAPKVKRLAEIVNPANPSTMKRIASLQAIVQKAGKEFLAVQARTENEFAAAFATMTRERVGALLVSNDVLFIVHAPRIVALALQHKLPSIAGVRESTEAGALMSYGVDRTDQYRRTAKYVDKILKGAKAGDLPIEQPTKFELVLNMKTARTLGLKVPNSILVQATKVIE